MPLPTIELTRTDVVWIGVHPSGGRRWIAYRFTSDWAYRTYQSTLFEAGAGSLGRGTFCPWGNSPDYDHYFKK